ncbi:guanylate kinase [Brevundimonas sp. BAL450]|jgi:guanylate kinase|uniref:Guanylate kinase n=1 Tax=Brevundimonas abyssalis TAR-001 TaxID=1391729 RepID=A0A8E0TRX9_9CAUL|nr:MULTISPECIES: guanylate kinase [Brevundimonas]MBG7615779.1 guanylate kinase [Brevundimonas sp. BAL450]GAD59740.1 guanylate kinase [Brevundimonas abyssalis TAR-001]
MSNNHTPRRGVLLIVASPSGAGKTSLCRRLMADHGGLELSISMTTRPIRPGEVDGRDYNFVSHEEFQRLVDQDAFLEWADVHGQRYGSPRGPIDRALAEGRDVLFDIDWQGAAQVAEKCPEDAVRVFILPPSLEELRRRLITRSQDAPEVIERRIKNAKGEIEHCDVFDYVFVNDDFDRSYAELAHIYHAERSRRFRNLWVADYKAALLREVV